MFGYRLGRKLAESGKTYDFPPFRPPSEADSLLLRLTRGCPWNRCAFCPMYRDVKFEVRPVDDVKRDIDTAREHFGAHVETVFVGDSNSLILKTNTFCDILDHLYAVFPDVKRVTSYARAGSLKQKSSGQLERLRAAGLTRLHIGLETGDRFLLKKIHKGASPETMIEGASKAGEAGLEVSLYVLAGIGGEEKWRDHASHTAQVINRIAPDFIRIRTLTPQPNTPIFRWWKEGSFKMATPETIVKEQGLLIETLSVPTTYLSDHVSNYIQLNGRLPEDKGEMLKTVNQTLDRLKEDEALRGDLENMKYLRRL